MDRERDADTRTTSLTIDNIAVYRVGEVIEALREAGFEVEINVARRPNDG